MFKDCKVKLYRGTEWIFVRLGGPLPMPVDNMESQYEVFQWAGNFPVSGPFYVRQNSVTEKSDPGKFVINSSRWPDAFWAYSWSDLELHFISRGQWGGGGLKHGEQELRFTKALTLHQAKLTNRGVEPLDRSFTGKATVQVGGNMRMLSPGNVLNWEWRSWDWSPDME